MNSGELKFVHNGLQLLNHDMINHHEEAGEERLSRNWTFEKAREFVMSESNGNCELLSINKKHGRDYMKIKCSCGNSYDTLYYRFKNGKHTCNDCTGKSRYSIYQIKTFVTNNSECELLSDSYENNSQLLLFRCSCQKQFHTTLKIFKNGKKQCGNCTNEYLSDKFSKSHKTFEKEVIMATGNEYLVIGEYKNRKTKVKIKHTKCGCEWFVNPSDFLHKESRCPQCNESKGERFISEWLTHQKITFQSQYKFNDCVNKRRLPFDFAVFNNDKLVLLIEYDGKQHYIKGCFGVDQYEVIKNNDRIKSQYCQENQIPLLRIPYTKFKQIPTILENALL